MSAKKKIKPLIQIQLYIEPKKPKLDKIQSNLSCHKHIKICSYDERSGLRHVGNLVIRYLSCDSLHCSFLGKQKTQIAIRFL